MMQQRQTPGGRPELWEVLVPAADNDGKEFPIEHHRAWDDSVRGISGGLTIMRSAKGQWLAEDGTLFAERVIPVRVIAAGDQISQIVDLTLSHYGQLAVMAYKISEEVLIVHANKTI